MTVVHRSNRIRQGLDDRIFDGVVTVIGILIMMIVLVPLIFVVAASFSDPELVLHGKVLLVPKGFTVKAYTMVFENQEIWQGYRNTIFYTVAGTAINIVLTVMAAYPLSRKEMAGRRFFTLVILFTMYFNGGLIPTYLLVRDLGMYNTVWAILIPAAISTYNLIVAKSFFEQSIPQELYESAKLDGCGNVRMLFSIVLPLSKAILAVLVLYYGVAHWNAYFNALIYLRDTTKHPLQVILRNILLLGQTEQMGSNDVGMGEKIKMVEAIKYSVIVVSSVPILLLYPLAQRYFVSGVMIGAVKG
ncbi:MAG: carbohydrate ABC transporter permease [Clostridia bacterium]|nr:carbohydrate ABC transporter permease [Clostridia bacterium]MBR4537891.1 carbohydrate ABC transporter permease [Clostridia bacterium]